VGIVVEDLIAGCFGLLLGVVGLLTGIKQLRNRSEFKNWKTTSGHVIERGTHVPNFAMLSVPAYRHAPLVKYSYQVDQKDFVSTSIWPERIQRPQHNTVKWAQKQAASYADQLVVHYNPYNPSESYLVLTSAWMLLMVVAASCLVLVIGGLFLLSWIVKRAG
jgi:hypothetical protein